MDIQWGSLKINVHLVIIFFSSVVGYIINIQNLFSCGCAGTVSFGIGSIKENLHVMWSSPNNFDKLASHLAVGISQVLGDGVFVTNSNFKKSQYLCNLIVNVCDIGLQRYSNYKILVCGKNSDPFKKNPKIRLDARIFGIIIPYRNLMQEQQIKLFHLEATTLWFHYSLEGDHSFGVPSRFASLSL